MPTVSYLKCSTIVSLPLSVVALGNPYVVFFQPTQNDLPLNGPIEALVQSISASDAKTRSCQASLSSTRRPWRGNVLVAKYADAPFGEMIPCGMNDVAIISRHFLCREPVGNELDVRTLGLLLCLCPSIRVCSDLVAH